MPEDLIWKIGGEAGYGILSSGNMFSQLMKELGYYVFSKTEYPSLIRGGHNTYTVRASKQSLTSHSDKIDLLVALDELTVKMHKNELRKNGVILYDKGLKVKVKGVKLISLPLEELSNKYKGLKKVIMATIGIGASAKILGIDKKDVAKLIKSRFKKKDVKVIQTNLEALNEGYDAVKNSLKKTIKTKKKNLIMLNANTAIAAAAIRAGCKFMSSYPMTPATSIMHYFAEHQEDYNLILHQSEDEIAAFNTALGASYAGVRSLVATSGGGFALMNEAFSLSGCSEVPIVLVLASRPGPATGLPTRTEQGDLKYAVSAGHGEFPRAIIAPGDVSEAFYSTLEAFNLADKHQLPVIILTDKYLSVSMETIKPFNTKYTMDRGALITKVDKRLKPKEKFKRYKITKSGVSPRTIPGAVNGMQCSIGDEHDEEGYIIEDPVSRKRMMDKRWRKMLLIEKYFKNKGVEVHGNKNSKTVILGWGSTKGIILEAVKELRCKFVQVKLMHPFPAEELVKKVGEYTKLVLIEQNMTGQLGSLVNEHTSLKIHNRILRYDGRPINPIDIIKEVRKR